MRTSTWADPGQPGFLGMSHAPFKPNADGMADMVLQGVSMDRLADRRALLRASTTSAGKWKRAVPRRPMRTASPSRRSTS